LMGPPQRPRIVGGGDGPPPWKSPGVRQVRKESCYPKGSEGKVLAGMTTRGIEKRARRDGGDPAEQEGGDWSAGGRRRCWTSPDGATLGKSAPAGEGFYGRKGRKGENGGQGPRAGRCRRLEYRFDLGRSGAGPGARPAGPGGRGFGSAGGHQGDLPTIRKTFQCRCSGRTRWGSGRTERAHPGEKSGEKKEAGLRIPVSFGVSRAGGGETFEARSVLKPVQGARAGRVVGRARPGGAGPRPSRELWGNLGLFGGIRGGDTFARWGTGLGRFIGFRVSQPTAFPPNPSHTPSLRAGGGGWEGGGTRWLGEMPPRPVGWIGGRLSLGGGGPPGSGAGSIGSSPGKGGRVRGTRGPNLRKFPGMLLRFREKNEFGRRVKMFFHHGGVHRPPGGGGDGAGPRT